MLYYFGNGKSWVLQFLQMRWGQRALMHVLTTFVVCKPSSFRPNVGQLCSWRLSSSNYIWGGVCSMYLPHEAQRTTYNLRLVLHLIFFFQFSLWMTSWWRLLPMASGIVRWTPRLPTEKRIKYIVFFFLKLNFVFIWK